MDSEGHEKKNARGNGDPGFFFFQRRRARREGILHLAVGDGEKRHLPVTFYRRREMRIDNVDAFPGKPSTRVARRRSIRRVVGILGRPRDAFGNDARAVSNHANAVCEQFHGDSKFQLEDGEERGTGVFWER